MTIVNLVAKQVVVGSSASSSTGGVAAIECDPQLLSLPSLAPGEELVCTADYVVEQDDVNRGEVRAGLRHYLLW